LNIIHFKSITNHNTDSYRAPENTIYKEFTKALKLEKTFITQVISRSTGQQVTSIYLVSTSIKPQHQFKNSCSWIL